MAIALCLLWPSTGTAQRINVPVRCADLPIQSIQIQGCDGTWCADEREQTKLHDLISLPPQKVWTEAWAANALNRLKLSGFFQNQTLTCTKSEDKMFAVVLVQLAPNRWIRRVRISGNQALYESEIMKQLTLRAGTAFNAESSRAKEQIEQQIDQIEDLYQKEGFDNAVVRVESTAIGNEWVDIHIRIREGRKAKVSGIDVDLTGTWASQENDALPFGPDVRCLKISKRRVRIASGLEAGSVFTRRLQRKTERKVREYLRARGVVRPEVELVFDKNTDRVRIVMASKGCYALRFFVRDDPMRNEDGYRSADTNELIDFLTFRQSGRYSLDEAVASRVELERYWQQQGYLFADVRLDYRAVPTKTQQNGGLQGVITYYTTLNYVTEIRNIRLQGNKTVSNAAIRAAMSTQTYDFFETGGYLLIEQMFADLRAVKRMYQDRGYFAMRFRHARPKEEQRPITRLKRSLKGSVEIYDYTFQELHFRLRKHPLESVIYVEIDIEEGTPVIVEELVFDGISAADKARLLSKLTLLPGNPYSPKGVIASRNIIRQFYQDKGHHDVKVEPQCRDFHIKEFVDSCTWNTVGLGPANVQFKVTPGLRFTVGQAFVRGAYRTNKPMILDYLPNPGTPLNRHDLLLAERKLRQLGIFSSAQIKTVGLKNQTADQRVALIVTVEERRAQFVDISTGFETLTSRSDSEEGVPPEASSVLSASIGVMDTAVWGQSDPAPIHVPDLLMTVEVAYRNRNFLGRAQELILPVKYGFSTGVVSLMADSEDPNGISALHRYAKFSPTLYEPHLGGTDLAMRLTPFVRYDRASKTLDEFETGMETSFSRTFFRKLTARLTVTGSGIQSGDFRTSETEPFDPKVDVELDFTLDYLDNPLNPTRGFLLSSGFSYINKREDGVFENFLKWEGAMKGAVNVRKALVVAIYFRYADSLILDGEDLPEVERYRLGGIQGMRGFEDDGIHPVDENGDPTDYFGGNVMLNGSLEMRFPILRRLGLWGVGFFDWGALAKHRSEFTPRSVRTSAGLGLRYLVGGQVPLRIDYGVNLDRRCRGPRTLQGCPAGQLEPAGTAQFAIMYPF